MGSGPAPAGLRPAGRSRNADRSGARRWLRNRRADLLAASSGADALGVDVSPLAVERARAKAATRGISARFEVADALSLEDLGLDVDTIIDQPGAFGPRRVSQDELRAAFGDGWTIIALQPDAFEINPGDFGTATAQAWLATVSASPGPNARSRSVLATASDAVAAATIRPAVAMIGANSAVASRAARTRGTSPARRACIPSRKNTE